MINWFKTHFIPHHENAHRPHFLHAKNMRAILALVLVMELLVFVLPTFTFVSRINHTNLASVLPGVLASLANDERTDNDLPELVVSPLLTKAAELKAEDMANKGYFAHTSPEGKTPWHWLDQVGYRYEYAGENLAINFTDSEDVTKAWMRSPTHRANIVKSSYKEVGTGIATGVYEGRETVFVAQVYANPRPVVASIVRETVEIEKEIQTSPIQEPASLRDPASLPLPLPQTAEIALAETEASSGSENETEVLGAEAAQLPVEPAPEPTPETALENNPFVSQATPTTFEKAIASPRHSVSIVLYVILGIIALAMVLNIFIKMRVQHPDLITNGMFLAVVIVGILVANNFISTRDVTISQGTDYSRQLLQEQIIVNDLAS